ncbi:MAG: hypothetical protein KA004_07085 [Verrucomicrobiales bacterium]|nr:hypothetical protein [Verrucomicrobiales bacterium]
MDYEDFLRVRALPLWPKSGKEALYVRRLGKQPDESFETYRPFFADRPAAVLANIALCLHFLQSISQAVFEVRR